jgi:hypothetical protein
MSFAYLLDDGFEAKVYKSLRVTESSPQFCVIWLINEEGFKWDVVKDYYIPFVRILSSRWSLLCFDRDKDDRGKVRDCNNFIRFKYNLGVDEDIEDFTYDQIINDDLNSDKVVNNVYKIGIKIEVR